MRSLILLALMTPLSAQAAAAPSCAIPGPSPAQSVPVAAPVADATTSALPAGPPLAGPPLPASLASLAFARHVSDAGAAVEDFGIAHGMHLMAARGGDEFMVFEIAPDGEAAVAGAAVELTVDQLRTVAAGKIIELGEQHGLRGFFVRSGPQFQVFYATPDSERVIPGVLWDATGHDLTRAQVDRIPGAVPTVVVGPGEPASPPTPASPPAAPVAALPLLEKANAGGVGSPSAPHLFMFIDPQCIYSVRAMQMLQPYVAAGRVRLSVVPLSILDGEDQGQSTRSALALLSKPADQIVEAWRNGMVGGAPAPEAEKRLRVNMAIAEAAGIKGTPTFVWRKADGTEGRIDGVPNSVDAMVASVGG